MHQARDWMAVVIVGLCVLMGVAPVAASDNRIVADGLIDQLPDDEQPSWPSFVERNELAQPPTFLPAPAHQCRSGVSAPLPPAVLSGGVLLAANWVFAMCRKGRI